jgi:hypothetical protein
MKQNSYGNSILLKDCITGKFHKKETIFKAKYDKAGITFYFNCEDDDIFSTMTKFNDSLYNEDVVEVFICPDGHIKNYIEIEISPLENVLQLKVSNDLNGNFKTEYILNDEIKRKVIKNDKGWIAEFFVPFSILYAVGIKGDTWLFNAYRIDRDKASQNFYAINPTFKPEYHHPECFIDLIFD